METNYFKYSEGSASQSAIRASSQNGVLPSCQRCKITHTSRPSRSKQGTSRRRHTTLESTSKDARVTIASMSAAASKPLRPHTHLNPHTNLTPLSVPTKQRALHQPSRLTCQAIPEPNPQGEATQTFQGEATQTNPSAPAFRLPSAYQTLKLVLGLLLSLFLLRALVNTLTSTALALSPPLLTYLSMALVFWPLISASALGALSLTLAARKGSPDTLTPASSQSDDASSAARRAVTPLLQQLVILLGVLTWLILVPCGYFQGFLGFWPWLLFSVYALFFAESAFVRAWLYGDLAAKSADKQRATPTSRLAQIAFVVSLVASHWLAARESPLATLLLTGQTLSTNYPALILLFFALWLHWDSTLILGKYFDRLVPPQLVVTTGPYRWVRHPIYTSYMLLFSGFCVGLRSYKSLVFLLATCLSYYFLRTKLEEDQLLENFGEQYEAYRRRVNKKFLPFLF